MIGNRTRIVHGKTDCSISLKIEAITQLEVKLRNDLTIIIPCFNEGRSLPVLIDNCVKIIANKQIFIVIVNNGSNDDSASLLKKVRNIYSNLTIVDIEKNVGYGNGILKGLETANTKYVGWTHADLQTDIFDLELALSELNKNTQDDIYIKGLRKRKGFFDKCLTLGMTAFETILFKTTLSDINGQPTILPSKVYKDWTNPPLDFSLDLFSYVNAKKNKLKIIRIKVNFPPRKFGNSSWNTSVRAKLVLIKGIITYSLKLKKDINVDNQT